MNYFLLTFNSDIDDKRPAPYALNSPFCRQSPNSILKK
jgi:hypothetical protein